MAVERWLHRYGVAQLVDGIHLNNSTLRGPYHKLRVLEGLSIKEHVEDDGATARYLSEYGNIHVFLCLWPRNADLSFPPGVERIRSLGCLAGRLSSPDHSDGPEGEILGEDRDRVRDR
jgi:hypothetical protein